VNRFSELDLPHRTTVKLKTNPEKQNFMMFLYRILNKKSKKRVQK